MVSLRWHVSVLVIVLDQLTKQWVREAVALYDQVSITSFLSLTHVQNTGISFGLLQGFPQVMTLIAFVVTACLVYYKDDIATTEVTGYALVLIIGGAIGNLIDRLLFGTVTDFIDFHVWPAFNVADMVICVGALLLVYHYMKE